MEIHFEVVVQNIASFVTDIASAHAFLYIGSAYLVGYVAYRVVGKRGWDNFLKDAFAADIWLSKSARVDYLFMLLFVGGVSTGLIFGFDIVETVKNSVSHTWVAHQPHPLAFLSGYSVVMVLWTFGLVVLTDFLHFFIHWVEHKQRIFWSFHATHHSARRLNPFVGFRLHPVELILVRIIRLAVAPAIFTLATIYLFGVQATPYLVYGIPAYFIIYYLYNHLRHTEVWIRFPRKLSYVFCSPAMHQIHHSNDKRWFDKNMSFIFSLWDWLFGTLYIPEESDKEKIQFGLPEEENVPNDSFVANLVNPFVNIVRRPQG